MLAYQLAFNTANIEKLIKVCLPFLIFGYKVSIYEMHFSLLHHNLFLKAFEHKKFKN